MAIHYFRIYRSDNLGIFMKANDSFAILPFGVAPTKEEKICSYLETIPVRASISGSRLIGPLVAMNNRGIILSRLSHDEEVQSIKKGTGLPVERLPSRLTAVGNLIACNDKGAIVSEKFERATLAMVQDVLDIPVERMSIASFHQVGAVLIPNNFGAVIHPKAGDDEIAVVREVLKVNVEPATINGGVPFLASGLVVNSKHAAVGSLTSGVELVIISRALHL